MVIDELLVGLGFKYDPKDLKKFKDDVSKTTAVLKKLATAAVAGAAAITGFTIASTRASDEQGKLAEEIGESVSQVDALQFAMRQAGGSSQGMSSALRSLSQQAAAAARGVGSGVEAFGLLGVSATDANGNIKQSSKLMLEIADAFKGFSKSQQIELAGKLGISDSLRLLQQGSAGINELTDNARKLGVTTQADADAAADFQDSLGELWQIVKQISRTITRQLAPILKDMTKRFSEWWKANRQIIEQKLPQWIHAVKVALALLTAATGAWLAMRLISHLASLITLFKTLSLSATVASASVLILPALIGAAIAALGLLAEDAKTFFSGGESFIGSMIEKYPEWESQLRTIAAVFSTLADLTTMIFDGWRKIIDLASKFSVANVKEVASNIPGFLADVTGLKRADNTGLIPTISDFFSETFGSKNKDEKKALVNNLTSNERQNTLANDAASNTTNTSKMNVDKVDIVIQAGIDSPQQIADAVLNAFQQTSQDLNTVVDQ